MSLEEHLPDSDDKWQFMQTGKESFLAAGYEEVGMDHYVLPGDELLEARKDGDLHRNFMGYTPFTSKLLIGLGVSSISDSWSGFAQNEKSIPAYYEALNKDQLPIIKATFIQKRIFFLESIYSI